MRTDRRTDRRYEGNSRLNTQELKLCREIITFSSDSQAELAKVHCEQDVTTFEPLDLKG
jgi:hypothetical protein